MTDISRYPEGQRRRRRRSSSSGSGHNKALPPEKIREREEGRRCLGCDYSHRARLLPASHIHTWLRVWYGWKRNKFTWYNHHEDESFAKERLDKVLANPRWKVNYSKVSVETLPAISDYSSILLSYSFERCSISRYQFPFKYEANWSKEEGCSETVVAAWHGSSGGETGLIRILNKLDRTRKRLQNWSKNMRRKKNNIIKIRDREGIGLSKKEDIAAGFKDNFTAIYKSTHPSSACIEQSIQGLESRVTGVMKQGLDREFTAREVEVALKQMSPFKSPGPDGFSAGFFQEHWEVVGPEISKAVLDFFKSGSLPRDLNHTHLALIPKSSSPVSVHDFRPISLYNVVYKLISKVLANRMKGLSALLHQAESRGQIRGVAVARGTKLVEWYIIHDILVQYEKASGQTLNKEKTSVFFSSNTRGEARDFILQQVNGLRCNDYNKYLGLPTVVGRSRYNSFRGLTDKIWKKINSWNTRFLSTAGKEVLIKSVLQAILAYAMSVFKLPNLLLKEIEALLAKFWWNNKREGRGIHWKTWKFLGSIKNQGGLGFRDLGYFNKALLAKQL
ncbi:uncharacterized protein LOC122306409 [Carya illinoinensis]|uniref:uncharacterized protein LOC122306409 n=1 Tax=Carya illinoinensis TaxID=32201 RepID=UPI001C719D08|nr:uncharacterized protein LOC122306409 [Carya illinoinensis]